MKAHEFNRIIRANGLHGETLTACRLVLIKGLSGYAAAKITGVAESTVSRALARLRRPICKCCGQIIKK